MIIDYTIDYERVHSLLMLEPLSCVGESSHPTLKAESKLLVDDITACGDGESRGQFLKVASTSSKSAGLKKPFDFDSRKTSAYILRGMVRVQQI